MEPHLYVLNYIASGLPNSIREGLRTNCRASYSLISNTTRIGRPPGISFREHALVVPMKKCLTRGIFSSAKSPFLC